MKKITKLILTGLASVLIVTCASFACMAAEPDITVKVDGNIVSFPDQEPTIQNNRTLVPVRFVAEELGYDVDWGEDDNTAIIDGGRIIFYIGTDRAIINGKNVTLDVKSELINNRTMVPLRVIAETLNCTVDWFGSNRMVLVNKRASDGSEMSLFERYRQSDLFWEYSSSENHYLVWKDSYKSLAEASAPSTYHSWWIEAPVDKSILLNQSLDCSIMMRTFGKEELAQVRDMLFTPYATKSAEVYDLLLLSVKGELWETFYQETSELYPLFSAMPPYSGTFGTRYLDNREVEILVNSTCTEFTMNLSAEGYVNPETPRKLTQSEIDFYTGEAKKHYCLGLWGLD